MTCLDGYQMARQGRAGRALGISAIESFIANTLSVCLLMLVAPVVARYAVKIGPPELFALILFGLTLSAYLSSNPVIKSFIMVALGMILGTQGIDTVSGVYVAFNINNLRRGRHPSGHYGIFGVEKFSSTWRRPSETSSRFRSRVCFRIGMTGSLFMQSCEVRSWVFPRCTPGLGDPDWNLHFVHREKDYPN
jgi:TctA family transporter